jgi:hypothetical protein
VVWDLVLPAVVAGLVLWLEPGGLPLAAQVALSLAIVVPLGPMIYRLAYQPLAEASVLVLLIVSVAVHLWRWWAWACSSSGPKARAPRRSAKPSSTWAR